MRELSKEENLITFLSKAQNFLKQSWEQHLRFLGGFGGTGGEDGGDRAEVMASAPASRLTAPSGARGGQGRWRRWDLAHRGRWSHCQRNVTLNVESHRVPALTTQ